MKQHKIAFFISILTTVISLVAFLCSAIFCFNGNDILHDISAALFSSSVFVIALSIIGYFIEKDKLKEKIISDDFSSALDSILSVLDDNNSTNRRGVHTIVIDVIKRTIRMKYLLGEYYNGLFIKDNELQHFINERLHGFVKTLSDFEIYNACPSRKGDVVSIHLDNIISKYESLINYFDNWMEKANFKLGKNFEFGDNFISEYEQQAEQLKNKRKL